MLARLAHITVNPETEAKTASRERWQTCRLENHGRREAVKKPGFAPDVEPACSPCQTLPDGEILVSQRVWGSIEDQVADMLGGAAFAEPAGKLALKGFQRPVPAFRLRCG